MLYDTFNLMSSTIEWHRTLASRNFQTKKMSVRSLGNYLLDGTTWLDIRKQQRIKCRLSLSALRKLFLTNKRKRELKKGWHLLIYCDLISVYKFIELYSNQFFNQPQSKCNHTAHCGQFSGSVAVGFKRLRRSFGRWKIYWTRSGIIMVEAEWNHCCPLTNFNHFPKFFRIVWFTGTISPETPIALAISKVAVHIISNQKVHVTYINSFVLMVKCPVAHSEVKTNLFLIFVIDYTF